jgi:hypothetical protein
VVARRWFTRPKGAAAPVPAAATSGEAPAPEAPVPAADRPVWFQAEHAVPAALLDQYRQRWGNQVLHVFDRGDVGFRWMEPLLAGGFRFVLR